MAKERILELDVIRGIAVFGIFIVNMMSFHSPLLYISPLKWWTNSYDHITYMVIDLFFQASFYPLFAFLFGYSLILFRQRVIEQKLRFQLLVIRRLVFLFFIGLIHAVLIWHGDILLVYALLGFLCLPFIKMEPKQLTRAGILLYMIANSLYALFLWILDFFHTDFIAANENVDLAVKVMNLYQQGSFFTITKQRVHDWLTEYNPQSIILLLFTIFPLFLIGAGLAKLKWLERKLIRERKWVGVLFWTFSLGLLMKLLPYVFEKSNAITFIQDVFGGPLQAISYATMILVGMHDKKAGGRLSVFSFVGRMSLSNYLFQSCLSALLFYGYGLRLFGKVSLFLGVILCICIIILQLAFSRIWLHRFSYGPVEWIWRSFTYFHIPVRKTYKQNNNSNKL